MAQAYGTTKSTSKAPAKTPAKTPTPTSASNPRAKGSAATTTSKTTPTSKTPSKGYSLPSSNPYGKPTATVTLPKSVQSSLSSIPKSLASAANSLSKSGAASAASGAKATASAQASMQKTFTPAPPKVSSTTKGYNIPAGNPNAKPTVASSQAAKPTQYTQQPRLTSASNMRTNNPAPAPAPSKTQATATAKPAAVAGSRTGSFSQPAAAKAPVSPMSPAGQTPPVQPAPQAQVGQYGSTPGIQQLSPDKWRMPGANFDGRDLAIDGDGGYIPENTLVKYNADGTTTYIDKATGQELSFHEGGLYRDDGSTYGGVYNMDGDFKTQDTVRSTKTGFPTPPQLEMPPELMAAQEQAITGIGEAMAQMESMWADVQRMNNESIAAAVQQSQNMMKQMDSMAQEVTSMFANQNVGEDPQLLAAIGLIRQEAERQYQFGLEELNARGVVQSGQLNTMLDNMAQGVLTQEQQLIGNRMSEMTQYLNNAVMTMAQARMSAMSSANSSITGLIGTGMQANASMANSMTGALVDLNGQALQNQQYYAGLDTERWKAQGGWNNNLQVTGMNNQNAWRMNQADNAVRREGNLLTYNSDMYRTDTNAAVQREGNNLSYQASMANARRGGGSSGPSFSDLLKQQGYSDERSQNLGKVTQSYAGQLMSGELSPQMLQAELSSFYPEFSQQERTSIYNNAMNVYNTHMSQRQQGGGGTLSNLWNSMFSSTPSKPSGKSYTLNKDR